MKAFAGSGPDTVFTVHKSMSSDSLLFTARQDTIKKKEDQKEEERRIKEIARTQRQSKPEKVEDPRDNRLPVFPRNGTGPASPTLPGKRPVVDPGNRPGSSDSRPRQVPPAPGRRGG